MKKLIVLLLLACGISVSGFAQAPEYPEPEFIGDVVAILPDLTTRQLPKESLSPRKRTSTGAKWFGIGGTKDEMVLKGTRAVVRLKQDVGIAFIIKALGNDVDPMTAISIFQFKTTKKERVAEYAAVDAFGDHQMNKLERIPFTARKFGYNSYMVVLQGACNGEFGIMLNTPDNLTVSTFGVDK